MHTVETADRRLRDEEGRGEIEMAPVMRDVVDIVDIVDAARAVATRAAAARRLARLRTSGGAVASPAEASAAGRPAQRRGSGEIESGRPRDLIVLARRSNALRCRMPGTYCELTLRTAVRGEVPGEIITVLPSKTWTYAGHPYLSGKVQSSRLDVAALSLEPLCLSPEGDWDPEEEYWGEAGDPIDEWAKPIIAQGKRPAFEMEQVIPGADPEDYDSDPILEASELRAAGWLGAAEELLMRLLAQDLRCLDAHAHLGNIEFDYRPGQALRHYAVGLGIGALTLGKGFDGALPWGLIDNRPFLRCMNGAGLCFWRLHEIGHAAGVFRRMLWLNPMDNQGARFNLAAVEDGRTWEEMEAAER
jgi:hypothetical protein